MTVILSQHSFFYLCLFFLKVINSLLGKNFKVTYNVQISLVLLESADRSKQDLGPYILSLVATL